MHPGAIVIVIWIIRALANRNGQSGQPSGSSGSGLANQEVSLRFVVLAVLFVSAYIFLAVLIGDGLEPVLAQLPLGWLSLLLQIGAAWVIPYYVLRWTPPWLAWRVFRPLNIPFLCRFIYWFTPGATARELDNFRILLQAVKGVMPAPLPAPKDGFKQKLRKFFLLDKKPLAPAADPWTIASLALVAEVQGDYGRAERLLHTFDICPRGMKIPGALKAFAFEELAWQAATRGDWDTVLQRARFGGGRSMPLLRLLSQAHLGGKPNRQLLWLAWLISPLRMRSFPFVQQAVSISAGSKREEVQQLHIHHGVIGTPRITHLSLLNKASEGAPIAMDDVFRLAAMWEVEMGSQGEENLLRRGLELGARDVLGIAAKIRESLLDEMEEMAAIAEGTIPEEVVADMEEGASSVATQLGFRLRNRLYEDAYHLQDLFHVDDEETFADEEILGHWEIWLELHRSVSRIHNLLGADELATLWYGGLRNDAWNSASNIYNSCRERAAWISILMFQWVAEIAEVVGDEEGVRVNRDNMKICGYLPPLSERLLLRMPFLRRLLQWFKKESALSPVQS